MKNIRVLAAALVILLLAAPSYADESSVYGSYTHVLGLNDTKGDARILCYSGLVKSLCQRVAATLSRTPALASAGVTRQELAASLPFLLKVEVMGEAFGVHGDDIALTMNGRAAVDAGAVALAMARMKSDEAYRGEVAAGLERFARLEKEVRSRQSRISADIAGPAIPATAPAAALAASQPTGAGPVPASAPSIAGGAAVVASSVAAEVSPSVAPQIAASASLAVQPAQGVVMSEAPAVPVIPAVPPAEAARKDERAAFPMSFPVAEAPEALYTLRSGMSYRDMLETAGAPAQRSECGNKVFYNYANVWVYFNDGELVGYLLMENWKGPCHPYVGFMGEILYF